MFIYDLISDLVVRLIVLRFMVGFCVLIVNSVGMLLEFCCLLLSVNLFLFAASVMLVCYLEFVCCSSRWVLWLLI